MLRGATWLTGTITVLGLVPSLGYFVSQWSRFHNWSPEFAVWLPLLQFAGMMYLLLMHGRPRSRSEWWALGGLNLWCLVVAVACGLNWIATTIAFGVLAGLRLGVFFIWAYGILGFPLIAFAITKAPPGHRFSHRSVRLWFGTVFLLMTIEPLAWCLYHAVENLTFPKALLVSPAHQLRIVALGSSTMHGHPYEPKFGIPQMVAWRVQEMYPDREVVLENLAVPGQSLRDAILQLSQLTFRPHLLLLYSGHNEFMHRLEECMEDRPRQFMEVDTLLNHSPLFRLVSLNLSRMSIMRTFREGHERSFINDRIVSPALYERRRSRFQDELTQLAQFGRSQEIPMLWYVPAGSESGFEPNRSWVLPGTSMEEKRDLTELWKQICAQVQKSDWNAAAELCRTGLRSQPQFADFHFVLGESLFQLGKHQEAQSHFVAALDNDGHPLRMNHDYQHTIAQVGTEFGIVTLNAEDKLRPFTSHGILDRTLFHDNVHPTIKGFFLLGIAGANEVFQNRLLASNIGQPNSVSEVTPSDAVRHFELTATDIAVAHRRIASGLRWLSRLRFDSDRRLNNADELEIQARLIDSGEIQFGEHEIELLR